MISFEASQEYCRGSESGTTNQTHMPSSQQSIADAASHIPNQSQSKRELGMICQRVLVTGTMIGAFAAAVVATTVTNAPPALAQDAARWSMPAPGKTKCAADPGSCGYPDASNTGPDKGTVFVRVPEDKKSGNGWAWEPEFGRLRITGAGAVLNGVIVHHPVVIDAPNATVSNSKIFVCNDIAVISVRAGRPIDGYNATNATIKKNLLGCDGPIDQRADRGVSDTYGAAKGMLVLRNNIFNVSNGVTVDEQGTVRRNYIHDLGHQPGDHHSGISTHGGGDGIVFDFNTVLLKQEGTSGAITVYSDFGQAKNVSITRNLVSGGSYCIYGGDSGSYAPAIGNIVARYNRFSKIYGRNGSCGIYGQFAAYSPIPGDAANNVWDENLSNIPQ